MAINLNELAVGKEVRVRGDGSSWEILELKGDLVLARNKDNNFEGNIPVQLIISIVNKTTATIPSSDIVIIDPSEASYHSDNKDEDEDSKRTTKKKKGKGRPKKEDK